MTMLQSVTQAPASAAAAALRDVFGGRMEEHLRRIENENEQRPLPPVQRPQSLNTPVSLSSPITDRSTEAGSVTSAPAPAPVPVLYESLSKDALETAWAVFRSTFLSFCPFLWFPPETTAQRLQRHRPFLLRCIVAATTTLVHDKVAQGRAIKELLAREMLVDNRSNMDLLLGLLVYITWGSDPMVSRSGTQSRLVMLALSLVCDMRLNKPLPVDQHMVTTYTNSNEKCDEKGYDREAGVEEDDDDAEEEDILLTESEEVLEKQRAVLGCFLVTSSYVAPDIPQYYDNH